MNMTIYGCEDAEALEARRSIIQTPKAPYYAVSQVCLAAASGAEEAVSLACLLLPRTHVLRDN
jgi:hypothetical protein